MPNHYHAVMPAEADISFLLSMRLPYHRDSRLRGNDGKDAEMMTDREHEIPAYAGMTKYSENDKKDAGMT
jgi:hypothetical protein